MSETQSIAASSTQPQSVDDSNYSDTDSLASVYAAGDAAQGTITNRILRELGTLRQSVESQTQALLTAFQKYNRVQEDANLKHQAVVKQVERNVQTTLKTNHDITISNIHSQESRIVQAMSDHHHEVLSYVKTTEELMKMLGTQFARFNELMDERKHAAPYDPYTT